MLVIRTLAMGALLLALIGCANSNASLSGNGNENGGSGTGRIGSMFRF